MQVVPIARACNGTTLARKRPTVDVKDHASRVSRGRGGVAMVMRVWVQGWGSGQDTRG
jgi:hypothetical protein